jgi:hypothetical protein
MLIYICTELGCLYKYVFATQRSPDMDAGRVEVPQVSAVPWLAELGAQRAALDVGLGAHNALGGEGV